MSEHREKYGNIRLSDWFNKPLVLELGSNFEDLTRGMATQPELKSDKFHDSEVHTLKNENFAIIINQFYV